MRTIVVLSGKGGTGKTSVTAGLAAFLARAGVRMVLADADVDASNLPLLLTPEASTAHPFSAGELAVIDRNACSACRACFDHCRFDALTAGPDGVPQVRPYACEGCGACAVVCPEAAIELMSRSVGSWLEGRCRLGPMVWARLEPGGESSGKLVHQVRQRAGERAGEEDADLVLVDGPPGIACPAISALTGVDLVLTVTEPSPSAVSDLERLLRTVEHFQLPAAAVINKSDLNPELTARLERELSARRVPVLAKLPYSEEVPRLQRDCRTLADGNGEVAARLEACAQRLAGWVRGQSLDTWSELSVL